MYDGRSHVLPFHSRIMFFRFEANVSAKFPSDGKRGTSGVLPAALGEKVKVIKHDSNFGLDVRICVRIKDSCLGLWMLHESFWV